MTILVHEKEIRDGRNATPNLATPRALATKIATVTEHFAQKFRLKHPLELMDRPIALYENIDQTVTIQ